jgi:sulfate adenylyltransferase (ADP) / ATP adenylyltransferase
VPRSQESFADIPINALGFSGALLVRNTEQLAYLREIGPLTVLKEVGCPA